MPSDVEVALGCDDSTDRCFAQASAHLSQPVNVLQDDAFVTRVERHALAFVHLVDVAYTIPSNTLTFEIPQIDIYAGPAGSRRETDPGVAIVGSTQPVAAGTVVTEAQHVTIGDDTPARPFIEDAIENRQEFVFIVVATPRLEAGAPIPAGAVQIDVSPSSSSACPAESPSREGSRAGGSTHSFSTGAAIAAAEVEGTNGGRGDAAAVLAVLLGIPAGCDVFDFSVSLQRGLHARIRAAWGHS